MASWMFCVLLVVVGFSLPGSRAQGSREIPCYGRDGRSQRCMPPFVNAAFNRPVEASPGATCGFNGPSEYCRQTSFQGQAKWCQTCDSRNPFYAHPPSYLTDFNNNDNLTWWQSETMLYDIQYPYTVNLTLHLGKAFDITYVRLKFKSSRPESFSIYKRTSENSDWIPYQFYSASCEETYGRSSRDVITAQDETKALCTHEFSDISPLSGGSVAFSTLEGRPSAYNFDNSAVLQEWVTATDIKIVLNRINTFGDEVFGDDRVLKSYYYAISDFAIGGRCKCSGHASRCVRSTGMNLEETLVCQCEHNTDGPACGQCKPFYNDRPWQRASATDANECLPCDCSQMSERCYFDRELYQRTGHGGHCLECRHNTDGIHCERCEANYYRRTVNDRCLACDCDPVGSQGEQCDEIGRCTCKPGVTGEKCDRCMPNFFEFGNSGCRACQCLPGGSENNHPECLPDTGTCTCKELVEGQNCDRCKPGYFNLQEDNEFGCIGCFCYGHSSMCTTAPGYTRRIIHSTFDSGRQRWTGTDRSGTDIQVEFNGITQQLGISAPGHDQVYFLAPGRYLGDQRLSYNQMLSFRLTVGEEGARASILDVVVEGDGFRVSAPIFAQGNPQPRTLAQDYAFLLHEHPNYQWTPTLTSMEFQKMLANITAIRIRGTYAPQGVGFIDDIKLESARPGSSGGAEINTVELCSCPDGYVGQFCESCAPGYRRDPPYGGPLARCVPCDCNGHSDACDVNSGRCICQHNTVGDNCERCEPGYYGYALGGRPEDCQRCPCPGGGECVELLNGEVSCINCQEGFTGNRCQYCADRYFGDPDGRYGKRKACQKCDCNENIDFNAVANCNSTTGECLKCIYNSAGYFCDKCLPGYYGDALGLPKGQCRACNCYPSGSRSSGYAGDPVGCDENTGECSCLREVVGKQCDKCRDGFWNIDSGFGCEICDCNMIGSMNRSCDISTGQCHCKPGVTGRRCDSCMVEHFGFSAAGCNKCECNPEGSRDLQCDLGQGQCLCWPNVEGRTCDRCVENKYNISAGCVDCPACYNLVQEQVNYLRDHLYELRTIIVDIGTNPQQFNDTDFVKQLKAVNDSVVQLLEDAKKNSGQDSTLAEQLQAMNAAINDVLVQCGRINLDLTDAKQSGTSGKEDITEAERLIEEAERALSQARDYIELEGKAALEAAIEAQTKFGQQSQRMTEIAEEAGKLADRQEEQADQIEETAKEALNTSTEALRIAEEALQKPMEIAREINDLKTDSRDMSDLLNRTEQKAQEAKEQAQDAYDEALGIYSDANSINLPDVDIDSLRDNADTIKDDSAQIKQDAEELMDMNRDLMEEMRVQKQMAEDMLDDGVRQQQIADDLMSEADVARDIAREAVSKAEQTLIEANETLKTLKGFEKKVKEGKANAEEAKKKIPSIEDRISDAEDKTMQAQEDLADAVENATRARDIAILARDTAEMASEDAGKIKDKADETKDRAFNLGSDSDDLKIEVDNAEIRLEGYEQQAEDDATLTKEALKKADEAKTSAHESSNKVQDALATVNGILDQLDQLDDIDSDKLEDLEQLLMDAERTMEEAQLQQRYETLLLQYTQQKHWLFEYTHDLRDLQASVENIQKINETIPRTCYNKPEIEPTFNPAG